MQYIAKRLKLEIKHFIHTLQKAAGDLAPRIRSKKWLLGVCAGISDYYHLPLCLLRALFVILAIPFGLSIIAYYLLAIFSPVED